MKWMLVALLAGCDGVQSAAAEDPVAPAVVHDGNAEILAQVQAARGEVLVTSAKVDDLIERLRIAHPEIVADMAATDSQGGAALD